MPALRRILPSLAVGLLALVALVLWRRADHGDTSTDSRRPAGIRLPASPGAQPVVAGTSPLPASGDGPSPIAADLNAPVGNVRRDLEIVDELLIAWQSNFPGQGNPVGENAEITAALTGENRLGFAFIPRGHRAINTRGELCDRWGTPFRLHQLSGTQMEIRSAGPDRTFATGDDAFWPPPAP